MLFSLMVRRPRKHGVKQDRQIWRVDQSFNQSINSTLTCAAQHATCLCNQLADSFCQPSEIGCLTITFYTHASSSSSSSSLSSSIALYKFTFTISYHTIPYSFTVSSNAKNVPVPQKKLIPAIRLFSTTHRTDLRMDTRIPWQFSGLRPILLNGFCFSLRRFSFFILLWYVR